MTLEALDTNEYWHQYYEQAWDLRRRYLLDLIQQGESDPLRAIKLLESFESFNRPKANEEKLENNLEVILEFEEIPVKGMGYKPNIITHNDGGKRIEIVSFDTLPTGDRVGTHSCFATTLHETSIYTYYNKIEFIRNFCRGRNFDAIIELGSGYSQNLIKLFYEGGPQVPYYGGEYTSSGTECARMLAELNPRINLTNFVYDFNNPDYSAIAQHNNVLVFTCHTIEQVEYLSDCTLASIAGIAEKVTCVHFEPFGYQMKQGQNEVDAKQEQLFELRGWNKNLAVQLVNAHNNGDINLTFLAKNVLGASEDGFNPTSLAVWDNNIEKETETTN